MILEPVLIASQHAAGQHLWLTLVIYLLATARPTHPIGQRPGHAFFIPFSKPAIKSVRSRWPGLRICFVPASCLLRTCFVPASRLLRSIGVKQRSWYKRGTNNLPNVCRYCSPSPQTPVQTVLATFLCEPSLRGHFWRSHKNGCGNPPKEGEMMT